MLSRLSVRDGPESRLRHWCSSRYLQISPLHREFRSPLPSSSLAVSDDVPELSSGISRPTCRAAYLPFTPNESEQRLPPPSYRCCWHGVCRGFLSWYCHSDPLFTVRNILPLDSGLRPEGLHPARGVASSGLPPLR